MYCKGNVNCVLFVCFVVNNYVLVYFLDNCNFLFCVEKPSETDLVSYVKATIYYNGRSTKRFYQIKLYRMSCFTYHSNCTMIHIIII